MRTLIALTLALASASTWADTCMVSPTQKDLVTGRFGKFREGGAANFGSGNAKPHMHGGLGFALRRFLHQTASTQAAAALLFAAACAAPWLPSCCFVHQLGSPLAAAPRLQAVSFAKKVVGLQI